jgi:hypothetical protein
MSYRCPHCHEMIYSDWRQNRWRTNVWFLQWDQVETMDPEIVVELKASPKDIQVDIYYAYRNAGKVIERIVREEFDAGGSKAFHIPRENTKGKTNKNQSKLKMFVGEKSV